MHTAHHGTSTRTMSGPRYSRRDFLAGVLATGTVAAVGTYFAPGGRSITLNFVTGEDPTGARDRLVDMWNGANPRAFVRVDQLSDSTVDAQAAMITKVEGGNADVLNLDVIDIPYFRREGHIEPIELPDDAEFVEPRSSRASWRIPARTCTGRHPSTPTSGCCSSAWPPTTPTPRDRR